MINEKLLIDKLVQCIKFYPSKVNLKRENRIDDEIGGYTVDGFIEVATFEGFLDTKGSSMAILVSDGGNITKLSKISLIAPFSKDYVILADDIVSINDVTYRVKNPNLRLNVCYIAELELVSDGYCSR